MTSLVPSTTRLRAHSEVDASASTDGSRVTTRPRGTARSVSDCAPPVQDVSGQEETQQFSCEHCGKICKSKAGRSNHQRTAHPDLYHRAQAEAPPAKRSDWSPEEIHLLALDWLQLKAEKFKGDKAQGLIDRGKTDRPYTSVRKLISDPRFLEAKREASKTPTPPTATPPRRSPTPSPPGSPPASPRITPPPSPPPPWVVALKSVLSVALLTSVNVDLLVPGAADLNQKIIDDDFTRWLPTLPTRQAKPHTPSPLPAGKRSRRRALYARVQELYKKNRVRCADSILAGTWDLEDNALPLEAQEPFWRNLLQQASLPDERLPTPVREVQWGLLAPISATEVINCLASMDAKTAPGLDQYTLSKVKQLPTIELVDRLNLWLLASTVPSALNEGYTSLIPKELPPTDPAQHRPITVSSILCRLYHKVISRRFDALCPAGVRQKAFRQGDGIAENTEILKNVIKTAKAGPRDLYIAFLDVRKAFDSVSHGSLILAAQRAGCPSPLLAYIKHIYAHGRTRLKIGGRLSEPISVAQGVKQGDPLSCILFNLVVDWALDALDRNIGFKLGEQLLSHLAFADDVVLVAETQAGLQRQIDAFSGHLAKSGLFMNAGKCATLSIVAQKFKRSWFCNATSSLRLGGDLISALKVRETYKYLGLQVSATGVCPQVESKLKDRLKELSRAPLKPQQRLWILRVKVIPALYHQLVLADPTKGYLKFLDNTIRAAVRRWTRLPRDTPLPAFYADPADGGLGLDSLELRVPTMKARRLLKLGTSADPVVREVGKLPSFRKELSKWTKPVEYRGLLAATKPMRRQALAHALYESVDGKGLRHSALVPSAHAWVTSGTSLITGRKFNASLGVRLNCLPTRLRAARGRPTANTSCDCCGPGVKESLSHVLQVCPRTHGFRVKRHDRIVAQTKKILERLGYTTLVEPHFHTPAGLQKPDLVAHAPDKASVVLDACIVSDMYDDPDTPHRNKVQKYNTPEICSQVERLTGSAPEVSSICISWRGVFSPTSAAYLRSLGLTQADLGLLSAITVEQGAIIHRLFNTSTLRTGRPL